MKNETTQTTETPMADDRVLGEVLIKKHPKVLIVGGGAVGIAPVVLSKLHKEFGEDLIILTPEEAGREQSPNRNISACCFEFATKVRWSGQFFDGVIFSPTIFLKTPSLSM